MALRGGRGRHLLAPDGKVLNLILAEGGKKGGAFGFDFELINKESNLMHFFFCIFLSVYFSQPTCDEACAEPSDWTAVTVAVGAKMSCEDSGTARPRLRATWTRLLCWAWEAAHRHNTDFKRQTDEDKLYQVHYMKRRRQQSPLRQRAGKCALNDRTRLLYDLKSYDGVLTMARL